MVHVNPTKNVHFRLMHMRRLVSLWRPCTMTCYGKAKTHFKRSKFTEYECHHCRRHNWFNLKTVDSVLEKLRRVSMQISEWWWFFWEKKVFHINYITARISWFFLVECFAIYFISSSILWSLSYSKQYDIASKYLLLC